MLHIYRASNLSYLIETIERGKVISSKYIGLVEYKTLIKNNTSLKIVLKF